MKVYAGISVGHPTMIFMPGVLPDADMHSDPSLILEELPDARVDRLVIVKDGALDDPNYEGPGSAFTIRAQCTIPEHDHYGEVKYFMVIHGEMEGRNMTEEDAIGAMDALKGIYPELMEQPV